MMDQEKFDNFLEFIVKSFVKATKDMVGFPFLKSGSFNQLDAETIAVIIGITGKNRGRISMELSHPLAKIIGDQVNGEPCNSSRELYLCLAEFTNIFSGQAVTQINNQYKGTQLRLTPPVIFGGEEMEVTTPNVKSASVYCICDHGPVRLDVGFEGV